MGLITNHYYSVETKINFINFCCFSEKIKIINCIKYVTFDFIIKILITSCKHYRTNIIVTECFHKILETRQCSFIISLTAVGNSSITGGLDYIQINVNYFVTSICDYYEWTLWVLFILICISSTIPLSMNTKKKIRTSEINSTRKEWRIFYRKPILLFF